MSRISFTPPEEPSIHTGASILCYVIPPHWGGIYVLLGKERPVLNWPEGSSKWSDFGGGRGEVDGSAEGTAAREFVEETLAVVKYFDTDTLPRQTHDDITLSLQRQEYTFKFYISYETSPERHFVVFVKQIPWDPDCVDRFVETRYRLMDARAHYGSYEWMRFMYHHPAVQVIAGASECEQSKKQQTDAVSCTQKIRVNYDFLEKTQLWMWSLPQLQTAVENNGKLRNGEYCRDSFLRFLPILLQELNE